MNNFEPLAQAGNYRVSVVADYYPNEPENDHGCPVIWVEYTTWEGWRAADTGYGSESARGDGLPSDMADLIERMTSKHGIDDGLDILDRWLRVFHGGSLLVLDRPGYRDYGYVTYITERMAREVWGFEGAVLPEPEGDEWMDYVNGDVFLLKTEKKVMVSETVMDMDGNSETNVFERWDDTKDFVVSAYGCKAAKESAIELLSQYTDAKVEFH